MHRLIRVRTLALTRSMPFRAQSRTMASGKSPAGQAVSEVAHMEGGTTKGSASAKLQSEISKQQNANATPSSQSQKTPEGQTISEIAHQEGGTTKGSNSANLQSQITKQQNAEQAVEDVSAKMANNPASVTEQDAAHLESRLHRATGERPPKGSLAADAHRLADANARGDEVVTENVTSSIPGNASGRVGSAVEGALTPEEQSQLDREANYAEATMKVGSKLAQEPENVTKEDADLLQSREQRVYGESGKGSPAAQAQKVADRNESR